MHTRYGAQGGIEAADKPVNWVHAISIGKKKRAPCGARLMLLVAFYLPA
jgi:hypothetical protein